MTLEQRDPLQLFEFKIKFKKEQLNSEFELKHPVMRNNSKEKEIDKNLYFKKKKNVSSIDFENSSQK